MSDILLPTLPTPGTPTDANLLAQIFYTPDSSGTPTSFEVINGGLGEGNLKSGVVIVREQCRPQSCSGAGMVGLTGNMDYIYSSFTTAATDPGSHVPIPGCAIAFYQPVDAELAILSWQLTAINGASNQNGLGAISSTSALLHAYIDGVQIPGSQRGLPEGTTNAVRIDKTRERLISGHWPMGVFPAAIGTFTQLRRGWHTAFYALWSTSPIVRLRIRNFQYMWFK